MKKIIILVIASLIIYGCAKDRAVNVLGNAIVNQHTQIEKAGA